MTPLEELTGFAEMLGHRVVTLHPAVHGGILARRDVPEDVADLEAHGIEPIDLVCVNLYPFEQTVGRLDVEWDEAIEKIDIGGPALLRAAAKNHAHVIPVCRPEDYDLVLGELRDGDVSVETRRELAARVFATTAAYDSAVAGWLAARAGLPGDARAGLRSRARPRLRREPAPEGRLLRRARRPHAPARPRRAAARQAALVQQPQRPLRRAAARARARRAGLRDRQAREPVRGRGRRRRSRRRTRRRSPPIRSRPTAASSCSRGPSARRSASGSRSSSSRCCSRPATTRSRSRRSSRSRACGSSTTTSGARSSRPSGT